MDVSNKKSENVASMERVRKIEQLNKYTNIYMARVKTQLHKRKASENFHYEKENTVISEICVQIALDLLA